MPVVVVATMTAKPEAVDTVRDACKQAIEAVHQEPGCELYSLHEAKGGSCSSSSRPTPTH